MVASKKPNIAKYPLFGGRFMVPKKQFGIVWASWGICSENLCEGTSEDKQLLRSYDNLWKAIVPRVGTKSFAKSSHVIACLLMLRENMILRMKGIELY